MPQKTNYMLVVGEQKTVNAQLIGGETRWKPILMSAIPNPNVPNGVVIAIVLEAVGD